MSASIVKNSDKILQSALEYRRQEFLDELPPNLPSAEKQRRWNAHIISLSSPSAVAQDANKAYPIPTGSTQTHPLPQSPVLAPDTKKRRLVYNGIFHPVSKLKTVQNSDISQNPPHLSINTHYTQPRPSNHDLKHEDGSSPFGKTGASVAPPILRHQSTHSRLEHCEESNQHVTLLPVSPRRGSSASQKRHVSVQEWAPAEYFVAASQTMSAGSSSMGHIYTPPSTAQQTSPFQSSSSHSSFGGVSLETSTNPTSVGMSRMDSLGGSSFQKTFEMMRVDSKTSPNTQHRYSMSSSLDPPQQLDFTPSQGVSSEVTDLTHDITQTGAQFADQNAVASAPAMQRRKSSNSRKLHPKQSTTPSMSRTSSSSAHPEIMRVPSEDGSYKEVFKISPSSSYVQPSSDKVMCLHEGCTSRPGGFKGEHEMRRHFDRDHRPQRKVYVCAPLADEPDFLAKSHCKQCLALKTYNEDYNAGEHLRRMHFNPKPKTQRGKIKPENKRGGKGGGTEPPMAILRKYMFTYLVNAAGDQISESEKVDPSSNVIIPITSFSSLPSTQEAQALFTASTSSVVPKLGPTEGSPAIETIFNTDLSLNSDALHPRLTVENQEVSNSWAIARGSNELEHLSFQISPFDPTSPDIDLNNDPIFYESTQSESQPPFADPPDFYFPIAPSSM